MSIPYPEWHELAKLPTPLVRLERASDALGIELWMKRDDMTGLELSGNKVRKLEFLVADAARRGADTLITCGGEQSNHCRATVLAAVKRGLRSLILLRTDDPANPPPTTGNILLDRLAGAEVAWISRDDWKDRNRLMAEHAERLSAEGRTAYVIPEGGSNAVGAWGYVGCAEELRADFERMPDGKTTVIHACGSGGTTAGLALGLHICGLGHVARLAAVNVCDDRDYFVARIDDICTEFADRYGVGAEASAGDVDIVDGYVGRGYAKFRPEELEVIRDLARWEGIFLDPVYTGKAFFALTRELARDPRRFGDRVVFLHTGGLFGLFPAADEVARVL